jgi:hypothetical protein
MISVVLLWACRTEPQPTPAPAVDVAEVLTAGQARAGVVEDDAALFGGISAEGRVGDIKIYNSRVQFILQSLRDDGSYYVPTATGILDADIVRPAGQPGRDAVEDWAGMYGIGRLMRADVVEVVDDGRVSGVARVHTEGSEAPMALITGALEAPGFIPTLGLRIETDYILPADSELMEVRTTVVNGPSEALILPGDVVLGAFEVVDPWEPGVGLDAPGTSPVGWKGWIGKDADVALGLFAAEGTLSGGGVDALLSSAQISAGFGPSLTVPAGGSFTWTRYYGVGRDLAALTDRWHAVTGVPTDTVSGAVTAPDGPVAGAKVNVLVGGAVYTLAVSGEDGSFSASVPAGAPVSFLADGRGTGVYLDLPEGAGRYSPYAAPSVQAQVLASYAGASAVPVARGRGVGIGDGLTLGVPGTLRVRSPDDDSFEVRVAIAMDPVQTDPALITPRPSGYAAIGWARDGEVDLQVEPGTYTVLVWRGITAETHQETVDVAAGAVTEVVAPLPEAYAHPGWLLGDPHQHGSPSADTYIAMEDRLISSAGQGIDLHFGTDHDHIADYRPLLAPLGLDGVLQSVVASEMSPVLRGHLNLYPLTPAPGVSNNGAWPWYAEPVETTQAEIELLRARIGDAVIQSNHPREGLPSFAGWSPGAIAKPDHWSPDFDAIEAMNAGDTSHADVYLDLILRGLRPTPVGVSDAHGHLSGMIGGSATWLPIDGPGAYSDAALRDAMAARATQVTRGPFLEVTPTPGGELVGPRHAVSVVAHGPSWIQVDTLELWRDGAVVESVAGTEANFVLEPDKDAVYLVFAKGSAPMAPLFASTPWAMTSAWFVDTAGDGFTPPLPALTLAD